ncbi:metallo-beta-lactamase domain-containing protein 1 [Protopterus annectens]|uniref:metallo-beta-lactamase domain-containing protein 1 n=1 Tax=Protopterus annectens TaxID=7888 RepID=UPI001CF936B3|nr:metallo-beta-lactamase domain-containing protein 1 [Protopterus annectens]
MSNATRTEPFRSSSILGDPYSVFVLKEGYAYYDQDGNMKADGTITLIKGKEIILVDTGSPWDREVLLQALSLHNVVPKDVTYVVCTHGHTDHVGNLNLFPDATILVSYDICRKDTYLSHDFRAGQPFRIDDSVEIFPTPGHTGCDTSVLVKGTAAGTVVVAGDLFECEEDYTTWQELSENLDVQQRNRDRVLEIADVVIPGHGSPFRVHKQEKLCQN